MYPDTPTMSTVDDTAPPTQNKEKSRGRVENLRPFQKGVSGNPGGRPKGLAKAVRERLDKAASTTEGQTGADLLVGFWTSIMANPKEDTVLRLKASQFLAERGWGKAPQYAPVEADDPLEMTDQEAAEVATQFDARLSELDARRTNAA
jgi:hypothetical protein